jgi:hypothetical protein
MLHVCECMARRVDINSTLELYKHMLVLYYGYK